jgi:hypothetical protein
MPARYRRHRMVWLVHQPAFLTAPRRDGDIRKPLRCAARHHGHLLLNCTAILSCSANAARSSPLRRGIVLLSDRAGVEPLGSGEPNGIGKFSSNLFFIIANLAKDYTQ